MSELMQQQQFDRLPFQARQKLLEGFGSVSGCLSEAIQEGIIRSLPSLSSGEASLVKGFFAPNAESAV